MKRVFTKLASATLAAVMTMACVPAADFAGNSYIAPLAVKAEAASALVGITESSGWTESAWVEWKPTSTTNLSYYKVTYSGTATGTVDNELVRRYKDGHWRADLVGLKAGSYTITVEAFNSSNTSLGSETATVNVTAHDRAGFSFSPKSTCYDSSDPLQSGGYKGDGTPKTNAGIIYITKASDIDTVTYDGFTGLSTILQNRHKGSGNPLIIRIIGKIDYSGDQLNGSGYISVKPSAAYTNINTTIEGIGEDATVNFGFLLRNAGNVEVRNLAIHDFADDGISLDTDNCNIWLHNCEFFYGVQGSGDKAKGDGSSDLKNDSQWITFSYNHYWDAGKCSLCGMKSETGDNYITYHHNWFDHSDSRHPRIRTMFVHVYNNFYDGNAKYGVGAAEKSTAFVEGNYFRNCKHPMMSSLQGSDIMENEKTGVADFSGDGTFSGENGGIIKAFNNYIEGSDGNELTGGVEPIYYNAADTTTNGAATQFDAYLVSSRDEQVPSSVTALVGGKTFDNANVDSYVLSITPEEPAAAKSTVEAYAGRTGGGDFAAASGFVFTDATDDTDYAINTTLRSDLTNYCNDSVSSQYAIQSIGGSYDGSTEIPTESTTKAEVSTETTTKNTEGSTEATTKETESTESTTVDPSGAASMGKYSFGSGASGANFNVTDNGKFGNITFNFRSVETTGVKLRPENVSTFTLAAETVVYIESSGNPVALTNGTETYTFDDTQTQYTVPAGSYQLMGGKSGSNSVITFMELTATGVVSTESSSATTESTTESTTATTESTTKTTESSTESTTQAPVDDYKTITDAQSLSFGNMSGNQYFNVQGVTNTTKLQLLSSSSITFTVAAGAKVSITAAHSSSTDTADRYLYLKNGDETIKTVTYKQGAAAAATELASSLAAGTYTITTSNGINVDSLDVTIETTPAVVKGDADGDGDVDKNDVTAILAYVVGKSASVESTADVTGDGLVNVADAYKISQKVLGIISSL